MHRKHTPKWTTFTHKIDIRKVQTVEVSQIPFSDFNRIKFKISSKKLPNMYTPPAIFGKFIVVNIIIERKETKN